MFAKSLLIGLTAFATFSYGTPVKRGVFNNILVVLLENTDYTAAIADPNLKAFANSGVLYTNWHGISHPSEPNYIAMVSGSTNGVTTDSNFNLNVQNLVDLLEAKGLTWKSYQENWPGSCFTGTKSTDSLYYRKHNPFISFTDIQTNPTRCAKIVDSSQLTTDINAGIIPNFAFYTPNIKNDGHDTGVAFAGQWLNTFLSSTNVKNVFDVVMVTFDEDSGTTTNKVYTAIAGKTVTTPGKTDATALTHYSLMRTLEQTWGLGNLGLNDATATPFTF